MTTEKIVHIWSAETGIVPIGLAAAAEVAPRETKILVEGLAHEAERLKGTVELESFNDRLRREWSLETGLIEGLYFLDRGTTTTLIERGFDPRFIRHGTSDRPAEQVIETMNDHKSVLDGLYDLIKGERTISTGYIKELHSQLTRSQSTTMAHDSTGQRLEIPLLRGEWKSQPNRPVRDGTAYAYAPPEQTASEMERLVRKYAQLVAGKVDPIVAVAWLHHRFTQIHPFQDGNGRVVRALVTLELIRAGLTPFIVTSEQRAAYLDSLEAADRDPSARGLLPLIAMIRDRCISDLSTLKLVATQLQSDRIGAMDRIDDVDRFNRISSEFFTRSLTIFEQQILKLRSDFYQVNWKVEREREFRTIEILHDNENKRVSFNLQSSQIRFVENLVTRNATIVEQITNDYGYPFNNQSFFDIVCSMDGMSCTLRYLCSRNKEICSDQFEFFIFEQEKLVLERFNYWAKKHLATILLSIAQSQTTVELKEPPNNG